MDKKRLLELAGIQLDEQFTIPDSEWPQAASDTVSAIADLFVKAIDAQGIKQGDADAWADANQELMAGLHEELKHRGYYGA